MGAASDLSTPTLAALLLTVAAPALGGPAVPFLPTDPAAALALVAFATAAWAAVVVPASSSARPSRALEALLAAAPFCAALVRAAPAGTAVPWEVPAAAAAWGALAASAPAAARRALGAVAVCLLAAGPLHAGVAGPAPRALPTPVPRAAEASLPGEPAHELDLVPLPWREAAGGAALRRGALARAPSPEAWGPAGPPYLEAGWIPVPREARAGIPAAGPAVRVVGDPFEAPLAGVAAVVASRALPARALDLDAFDALYLPALDGSAGDAAFAPESADAIASFVRRGGLLVGSWHPREWPEGLARRLAAAGAVDERGALGARAFGLGHVARAATAEDVRDLLASPAASPAAGTAFDRALVAPEAPAAFPRWSDEPASRRGAALLVLLFVAALFVAATGRGAARAFGVLAVTAVGAAGAAAATPPALAAVATPFAIDLGGAGGRRVEGLFVAAGPRGVLVPEDLRAAGGLRVLGFTPRRVDGRLRWALPPFGEGFVVEEGPARGDPEKELSPAAVPSWAARLVTRSAAGEASLRVRAGVSPYRGPRPGGWGAGEAARTVALLPGAPDRP